MTQRIPPQSAVGFELRAQQYLRITDPQGQQVADLFCFSKDNPEDALSSGRSIDYNDTLLFTRGHKLYSQSGQVMLEIVEDNSPRHDFLVTPCSLQMFHMIHDNQDYHPSCLENLERAFANKPVNIRQIGTTFNVFMNVAFHDNGKIRVEAPLSRPGDSILLQAKMDLIVGLTACSDEGSNAGECKPIAYEILDVDAGTSGVGGKGFGRE